MKIEQYTYWSMTLNNPDENDWIMIKNPNEKYIRSLVWTREIGEGGTEHIQAWVRLQRNNSMTFMKKLYPRGHFRFIDRDEYNENTHAYAQKEDDTTAGKHHITLHDPLPANDTLLYKVIHNAFIALCDRDWKTQDHYNNDSYNIVERLTLKMLDTPLIEREMVCDKAGLEKIFCSPAYEKMKTTFWKQILFRILRDIDANGKDMDGGRQSKEEASDGEGDSEDYEECEGATDEGSDEGSDDQASEDFD